MKFISHAVPGNRPCFTLIEPLLQPWKSLERFRLAMLLALACTTVSLTSAQSTDVLTYHNDNAKTGQQLHEEILTPANVTAAKFGTAAAAGGSFSILPSTRSVPDCFF